MFLASLYLSEGLKRINIETGCSGLVHCNDLEGWDGKGVRRGVQDGEHMYNQS